MTKQNGMVKRKISTLEMMFIILFSAYYLLPSLSSGIVHFSLPLILGILYIGYVTFRENKLGIKFLAYIGIIAFMSLVYLSFTDASALENVTEPVMLKRFISKFYQYFCMYLPMVFFSRVTQTNVKAYR